ncbi:type IV pili methyl-accepting chemotaxis transducer N-terminal domain-containing protein|uniref:methyl-accepting chemotaxis protein n=1 Tax=Noviherbaspirillum sp. L7-7A TaxID=2850560 RepID=UPI001C2B9F3D|nr:methyl-accepting chemotaxis protein [Noviherbaspirillum sp. L7-7A]MBV0879805.1 type IV pili methyl-accepting chemotaxis transducer N-terminal domain-containing protein [Noviherbaspirillum sp. L7-7A]
MAFNLDFLNKLKKQRVVPELEPALANAASAQAAAPSSGAGRKARGKGKAGDAAGPAASEAAADARFSASMFRRFPLQYQMRILLGLLGGSLLLGSGAVWLNASTSSVNSLQSQIAGNALMHSQRIGKAAPNAIQGNASAFSQLVDSRRELNTDLDVLANGGAYQGRSIPGARGDISDILTETRKAWASSDKAAGTVLKLQKELSGFGATLQKLNALSPTLLELTEQISTLKAQGGASPREIAAAGQLVMLTQRLGRSANEFLTSEGVNPETAFLLGKDTNTFRDITDGFLNGSDIMRLSVTRDPDTREKLMELQKTFADYQKSVSSILGNLQNFIAAKQAEQLIFTENEALRERLTNLQRAYRAHEESIGWTFWPMLVFALTALLSAAGIARVLLLDSRYRAQEAESRRESAEAQRLEAQRQEEQAKAANDQNQAAILRLMNELQEVADGDLTVQATVSEDITGAIADSLNYTVEELRGLVGRVTKTAEQVRSASNEAQSISAELLDASQKQSKEIQATGQAVLQMASQITEVSRSASESAEVARHSVTAAEQGSRAVENAIKGMTEIREQIQETSKRIKRLGESSQEIGEITELISDITEQTNVLALNAAIQAASAGEAGRGFSVVAEEVQRLAERSAEATKQIGALVRTIQTDTHDAVAAMEKSTQGVVEGARLSDAAGAALLDIRRVSNQLAELIQEISAATGRQAQSASSVAGNIQNILTVTEHTQQGTQQTAQSIQTLSQLAEELKNSVSRFRVA